MLKLSQIKQALRNGAYAWPGGYPLYFVASDGEAMSFAGVRMSWRDIVRAYLTNDERSGYMLVAVEANWEDAELHCCVSGDRIESAYAD